MNKKSTFSPKVLNPKESTIQSLLSFSKSVKAIKNESLPENILLFLN
ncbi:hypothetical protein ACF3NR_09720 [Vaginella massiliensis]|nr:hypothetical protein [Vaginella massiliensis]